MPHAHGTTSGQTTSQQTGPTTSTTTVTPNAGQDFNDLIAQLMEAIGGFESLDPADIFNQLEQGGDFINQLAAGLSGAFQPFVESQLQGVADIFRQTGNEGPLAGTGGPNRLTQVALPQALASINQPFGGQLSNLVGSVFGDLTQANIAGQQGQLGLINSLAQALGQIPVGQTSTTASSGTNAFESILGITGPGTITAGGPGQSLINQFSGGQSSFGSVGQPRPRLRGSSTINRGF